jgi:hypothetical protein
MNRLQVLSFFFLAFLMFFSSQASLQTVVSSTGGDQKSSTGSVSFTIGEVVIALSSGQGGSVAAGVQQPYEFFVVGGEKYHAIRLGVGPNPTTDFVILTVDHLPLSGMRYLLFNINGQLIQYGDIGVSDTRVLMQGFPPSMYILKVMEGKNEIKSFKIIKN